MISSKTASDLGLIGCICLAVFATYAIMDAKPPKVKLFHTVETVYKQAEPKVVYVKSPPKLSNVQSISRDELLFRLLYDIESAGGKMRYRPKNKAKSCATTEAACGYHQMTGIALEQIGCTTVTCYKDRDDEQKSKAMALRYLHWLSTHYPQTSLVFRYLAYNQGPTGIDKLYTCAKFRACRTLGKAQRRRTLNNLPKSKYFTSLKGSYLASAFLAHWTVEIEKRLQGYNL